MAKLLNPVQNIGVNVGIWIQRRPKISQHFGEREECYAKMGYRGGHPGIDIAEPLGTPLFSPIAGTIKYVPDGQGYGNGFYLVNKIRGLEILMCHLDTLNVKDGQRVKEGDILGTIGSTGNSSGPHLHLGIRKYVKDQPYNKGWLDPEEHFVCWKGTFSNNSL